jgi:hypothetical protein
MNLALFFAHKQGKTFFLIWRIKKRKSASGNSKVKKVFTVNERWSLLGNISRFKNTHNSSFATFWKQKSSENYSAELASELS